MEEFLAVMAHELRHLTQVNQTLRTLAFSTLVTLGTGLGIEALRAKLPAAQVHMVALSATLLVFVLCLRQLIALKRRQEDDADQAAINFVGALPLISALVKVTLMNGGSFDRSSSRYRSLHDRIQTVARLAGLSEAAVSARIDSAKAELGVEGPTPGRKGLSILTPSSR